MGSIFLWREMPDFERLRPRPENAAYREAFYRRWGVENAIVCGTGRAAEYMPWRQRLSIKLARGGRERYFVDGRSIAVDDDSFLILNDNRVYGSRFDSNSELESFSVFFRPGMAEEILGAMRIPVERALDRGNAATQQPVEFTEALHPHDSTVSPVLRYIQYGVRSGVDDGDWYEEQFQFLLERMLVHQRRVTEQLELLPALKSATRREVGRRLALAVDLVHAGYEDDIGLPDMARAACLSKFHFLRLFTELYGLTPHAFLQRKRALAAARLLERGGHSATAVATRVGFNSRATMARQLRRWSLD